MLLKYFRVISLLIFSIFLCVISHAQNSKKIEIINSDSLTFDKSRGSDMKILHGHVIFKHDNVIMHCDSARFLSENNLFDAFSNIHIIQGDTIDVWGDSLKYNGNTKLAQLRGNVKMKDRKMTLTTQFLDYDMNASLGKYFNNGKIVNEENTLTSNSGIYYSNKKEFFFKKNVVLHNKENDVFTDTLRYNTNTELATFLGPTRMFGKDSRAFTKKGWYKTKLDIVQLEKESWVHNTSKQLNGDTIYYDHKKGNGRVFSNVIIHDTTQHATIKGRYAYFKEKPEYYLVKDSVLMEKEFEGDTLFLHADTLIGFTIDTVKDNRIIKAYHKVRFYKTDIQGKCDSLVYKTKDSVIVMHTKPILWAEKSQITAKKISIFLKNNEIDKVNIDEMAFIVSQDEDTVNFNQVKGARMIAYFKKRKFSKLDVSKNGETIYYMRNGKDLTGVNKAICDNLTVKFKNDEVDEVIFRNKPSGTMYPPSKVTEKETKLQDFSWLNTIRPKNRYDLFRLVE